MGNTPPGVEVVDESQMSQQKKPRTVMMPAATGYGRRSLPRSIDEESQAQQEEEEKADACMYFLTVELQARYVTTLDTTTKQREPELHLRSWKLPHTGAAATQLYALKIELQARQIVEYPRTENDDDNDKQPHHVTFGGEIKRVIQERVIHELEDAEETGWITRRELTSHGRDDVVLAVASDKFLGAFASAADTHKALKEMMAPHLSYVISELASSFESIVDLRDSTGSQLQDDVSRESSVLLVSGETYNDPDRTVNRVCVLSVGGDHDFWHEVAATRCIPQQPSSKFASQRLAKATVDRVTELLP